MQELKNNLCCMVGYIKTKIERTIPFMCEELNFHIERVNTYCKKNKIDYNIDLHFDAKTVDPRSTKQNTSF